MKNNPNKREQELKLKDGRTIFKTHNGFRSFVETKKGDVTPISSEYYNKVKSNKE